MRFFDGLRNHLNQPSGKSGQFIEQKIYAKTKNIDRVPCSLGQCPLCGHAHHTSKTANGLAWQLCPPFYLALRSDGAGRSNPLG